MYILNLLCLRENQDYTCWVWKIQTCNYLAWCITLIKDYSRKIFDFDFERKTFFHIPVTRFGLFCKHCLSNTILVLIWIFLSKSIRTSFLFLSISYSPTLLTCPSHICLKLCFKIGYFSTIFALELIAEILTALSGMGNWLMVQHFKTIPV